MDINNIEHFNPKLKLGAAYRISRARAAVSRSSLRICPIQSDGVKNSLPRQKFKDGLSSSNRSISDTLPFGNANRSQSFRIKVDIENLDGNIIEFTMWDDLATQFDKKMIEKLEFRTTSHNCRHLLQSLKVQWYNFKAIVTDETTDAQFTFFTPAGDKATGHPCSKLAHKYKEADPRQIPIEIRNTKGQKHIF
ncbi:hypothetical protein Tco_0865545 [Tanacetum coccineum]